MDDRLTHLLIKLESAIHQEDFVDISYDVIEELASLDNPFNAVPPILLLMEKYPNIHFGNPGPLVHFLETFYKQGYEEELIKSIERCPTQQTVWMLNRIINGSEGERKKYYLNKLNEILTHPNIDEDLIEQVEHFKKYQKNS